MIETSYRKVAVAGSCNAHAEDYPFRENLWVWVIHMHNGSGGGIEVRLCDGCLREVRDSTR